MKTKKKDAPKPRPLPAELRSLFRAAAKARENAYAPYSGYRVGAAIRLKNGKIYAGCNVENSSIGATVCAERGAIQNAVAHEGKIKIAEILVVTDASPPWMPCGLCRQVLSEFVTDAPIHSVNPRGERVQIRFKDLYPAGFSKAEMT